MATPLRTRFRTIWAHNVQTLQRAPLAECAGALGDLGTLLPLMIAMALRGSIDLASTLVFSGLTNIATGVLFGIPLPVQPMKAIAALAISRDLTREETAAAGLTMGFAVLLLSATGTLRWLHRVVPAPVVKGIQVGASLSLVISAGASLVGPLDWTRPAYDNKIWALAAFGLLLIVQLVPRIPYALVVLGVGLIVSLAADAGSTSRSGFKSGLWRPTLLIPSRMAWRTGAVEAAIPQLPLTTLNSILAVPSLAAVLLPECPPPSTTALGISVAAANLIQCWFGGMPTCHGSGGLAGQCRFGARSGMAVVILGAVKLALGLFGGNAILPLLERFPKALLGIMVLAAGVELAKVGQHVRDPSPPMQVGGEGSAGEEGPASKLRRSDDGTDPGTVMLVTAAGCLAFKNDAVGFCAGLLWHWSLQLPPVLARLRHGRGAITLDDETLHDEQHSLVRD